MAPDGVFSRSFPFIFFIIVIIAAELCVNRNDTVSMLLQLTIFDIELKNNIEINFEKFFGSFDYYKNRWRNSKFPEQTRTSGLQNNISVSFKRKATDFRETAKVLHCDKYTHFDANVFIRRSYKLVLIIVTILIVLGRVLNASIASSAHSNPLV